MDCDINNHPPCSMDKDAICLRSISVGPMQLIVRP